MANPMPQANGSFRDGDAQQCNKTSVFCCPRNIRGIISVARDRAEFVSDVAR
jgi:hypothetical protein